MLRCTAEGDNPLLVHRLPSSRYDPFSRMWHDVADGPEPCLMEGPEFMEWMENASPEELEFFAEQDHAEIFARLERFTEKARSPRGERIAGDVDRAMPRPGETVELDNLRLGGNESSFKQAAKEPSPPPRKPAFLWIDVTFPEITKFPPDSNE